jgi:phosphatidate cytidylyltransferase
MDDSRPKSSVPKWKNIGIRAVSGLSFGLIALVPFYFGGVYWAGLVALIAARAVWEWVRMSDNNPSRLAFIIPLIGVGLALTVSHFELYKAAALCVVLIAALSGIERLRRSGAIWAAFGFIYIVIPAILLVLLRGKMPGVNAVGFQSLIYVILVVIAADTGAYLGGSYFRGPKIAPKLSPNKTWSGFVSGVVFACLIGGLSAVFIGFSPLYAVIIAAPIVVFSVVGDFLESGLKRRLDVKDTGGVLPGHGGVLDRVDSLMMAVVFVALLQMLAPQFWPIS